MPEVHKYVIECGDIYFHGGGREPLLSLPMAKTTTSPAFELVSVSLPPWASDISVAKYGGLLVDRSCVVEGDGEPFTRCDWWQAAFYFLSGWIERKHEDRNGPIHSYALRLRNSPEGLFDHAWVNRIMLFLRRWAAHQAGRDERELFERLPDPVFDLTHDVDAVAKTLPLRVKQTAFSLVNFGRLLTRGESPAALKHANKALKFSFGGGDYWCLPDIRKLEEEHGCRSTFHFYGGPGGYQRTPPQVLLDPTYSVCEPRLANEIRLLAASGWNIGLHQAFGSWRDAESMIREKERLEGETGSKVVRCRQHWLRFSWDKTWQAQEAAGFEIDSTLGFNDRPGFRNGCALNFHPWDRDRGHPMKMSAIPLVLMDSHLYDYGLLPEEARNVEMARWVDEVKAVNGVASFVWHQRVMHPDYGWAPGFRKLLSLIA